MASLETAHIHPGISETLFAANRAAARRSYQFPPVYSADSTAFRVSSGCRESVDRNAPVSRESRAAPRPEKPRETFQCARSEERLRQSNLIVRLRRFRASLQRRLRAELPGRNRSRA